MRESFVEQSCFITIVDITGGVAFLGWKKYSFFPLLQFIMRCCRLLPTTNHLVHNGISLSPPMYEQAITLPVIMPKLICKAVKKRKYFKSKESKCRHSVYFTLIRCMLKWLKYLNTLYCTLHMYVKTFQM